MWHLWFCNDAAERGQIIVLKYLHQRGYLWNYDTFTRAVAYGD